MKPTFSAAALAAFFVVSLTYSQDGLARQSKAAMVGTIYQH